MDRGHVQSGSLSLLFLFLTFITLYVIFISVLRHWKATTLIYSTLISFPLDINIYVLSLGVYMRKECQQGRFGRYLGSDCWRSGTKKTLISRNKSFCERLL